MHFISSLRKDTYPHYIPYEFYKNFCNEDIENYPANFYQHSQPLRLIERSHWAVRFSLGEPLNPAWLVRAEHGNNIVKASAYPEYADAHFIHFEMPRQSSFSLPNYLAIKTADCLAVTFACEINGHFFGAISHAGWKGYSAGILQNTLSALKKDLANYNINEKDLLDHLHIVIAPAIFGVSYQCKEDVQYALIDYKRNLINLNILNNKIEVMYDACINVIQDLKLVDYIQQSLNLSTEDCAKSIFPDLQLLAALELYGSGVPQEQIHVLRENTYTHPILSSFRRSSHDLSDSKARQWTHLELP